MGDGDPGFGARLTLAQGGEANTALGRRARLSESAIRAYRDGSRSPKLAEAVRLAGALGVRLDWLATGEGPMRDGEAPGGEAPSDAEARLAARLRDAARGEGADGIALRAGVPAAAVRQALAHGRIGAVDAARVAAALGVTAGWLVAGEGSGAGPTGPGIDPELMRRAVIATLTEIARDRMPATPEEAATLAVVRALIYVRGAAP